MYAAIPVGSALIILPMAADFVPRSEPMAETLLIVFVVFVVLGMPISIALGVGALAAACVSRRSTRSSFRRASWGCSPIRSSCSRRRSSSWPATSPRGAAWRAPSSTWRLCWSGRFRGGLAYVNILDSMIFGGISGSAVADVSALGTFLIPQMVRKGYDKDFATA